MTTPRSIETYFTEPHAGLFADDATVRDEAHEHRGRAAIAAWLEDTARRYRFTSALLRCERQGADWLATARVAGDFPGSPVELRYRFTLSDGRIAKLEIS